MDRILLESKQPVTLEATRELRKLVEQLCESFSSLSYIKNRMLLCLSEATTNIVNHASPKTNQMLMRLGCSHNEWWMEILDNGEYWDPTANIEPGILDEFLETESGRGISLLHGQCDRIEYQTEEKSQLNSLKLSWTKAEQNIPSTILIVDDDNSLRRIYQLYLEHEFEVVTAASGKEALEILKSTHIDLVLSDIYMPQMDGVSLREHLINDPASRLIPFVFLTSANNTKLMEKANNLGIDDYLVKPVEKPQLIHTIKRVLRRCSQINQQLNERLDKEITSALTPKLPSEAHNWRFSVASRNTGQGGGDILLHQSGDNQFKFIITDIMGHDDSAKFFAHVCGGYLHGLMNATKDNVEASYFLEQLSEFAIHDNVMSKITLTCCTATLSPDRHINMASAGHPSPLLITADGVNSIPVGGVLPGLIPDTKYHAKQIRLEHGQRIAFYTDGLFESAENSVLRDQLEQQICSALLDTLSDPIDESLKHVMSVFDQYAGTPPKDDVLLILVEADD